MKPRSSQHCAALSARVMSPEWRAKISAAAKLRRTSDATKLKMSLARKGKQAGADNPMFGRVVSDATREKLSTASKRQPPRTEAHKERLREYNRTRVLSPETKARMKASMQRAWEDPAVRARASESHKQAWARDDGTRKRIVSAAVAKSLRERVLLGSRGRLCAYGGVVLKSQIELRAASTFDAMGWTWEYEPYVVSDLDGSMVPDFLVDDGIEPALYEVGDSGRKFGKLLRLAIATGMIVHGLSDHAGRRANQHPAWRPEAGV